MNRKAHQVETAIHRSDRKALIDLAESPEGLVTSAFRRLAWPLILGVHPRLCRQMNHSELPKHKEEKQILIDVQRAFTSYPDFESDKTKSKYLRSLRDMIIRSLRETPALSYYQGFHDICQVLLLVFEGTVSQELLDLVHHVYIMLVRDFMLPDLDATLTHLRLIPLLFKAGYPDLYTRFRLETMSPDYSLSALITLFTHNINDFDQICLLLDFLFARHDMFLPAYIYVEMAVSSLSHQAEIENDPPILHALLSKSSSEPRTPSELHDILQSSVRLYRKFPPTRFPAWLSLVSRHSVLKTTACPLSFFADLESPVVCRGNKSSQDVKETLPVADKVLLKPYELAHECLANQLNERLLEKSRSPWTCELDIINSRILQPLKTGVQQHPKTLLLSLMVVVVSFAFSGYTKRTGITHYFR